MPTPLTRNASDPKAVRDADRLERQRTNRFTQALSRVMSTPEGRVVMGEVIRSAGVRKSVLARDVTIHHLAAVQNFGLEWDAKLWAVDDGNSYQLMEREHQAWLRAFDERVIEAHERRALTQEQDDGRPDTGS